MTVRTRNLQINAVDTIGGGPDIGETVTVTVGTEGVVRQDSGERLYFTMPSGQTVVELDADGMAVFKLVPTALFELGGVYTITVGGASPLNFEMPDADTTYAALRLADSSAVGNRVPGQHGWHYGGDAPGDPDVGAGWFDPDADVLRIWTGSQWEPVAGSGAQRPRQGVIDLLTGDEGGDIDFTRTGTGNDSNLRGELRDSVVDTPALADGAVTGPKITNASVGNAQLADEVKDQLLPTLPATGQRSNKVPKFDGDTLGWELDQEDPETDARLRALEDRTQDIAGDSGRSWANTTVATEGGLIAVPDASAPGNAAAAAAAFAAAVPPTGTNILPVPANSHVSVVYRIPTAATSTDYRIQLPDGAVEAGVASFGVSGSWRYYGTRVTNNNDSVVTVSFQRSFDDYTWTGFVEPGKIIGVAGARVGAFTDDDETKLDSLDPTRQLPAFPAPGSRDNKIPKFDGDALGWEDDGGGSGAPTLSNITSALGLDAVAAANRGDLIKRHDSDDNGYDYVDPGTVGWIGSKAEFASKVKAIPSGYGFAPNSARDEIDFTAPDTTEAWPTQSLYDDLTEVVVPEDTDIMPVETGAGKRKIEIADLREAVTEGLLDHVRIIQHGKRTAFAAPPSGWTWDIENHLTGNNQRDKRHITLAATGGATPDSARAWWAKVFQGGTANMRLKTSTGEGVGATCETPARGIKQGQPFYLFDLILDADLSVTAATGLTTAQLPVAFNYLAADTDVIADTLDIEGATIEQVGGNVAKVTINADGVISAGDGILVTGNDHVAIKPPAILGGFWGNAREGEPDIEVLRRRDLIVDDTRSSESVDITWSNGWTIRGLRVPSTGIGMLNDQSETLSPAPGSTQQGQAPAGDGSWSFTGGSSGHLVWNGRWPEHGMDLKIAIDMSDFQTGDRIHMTLDTNNNNLWGSARTPDRGVDFHGAGDSQHHSHTHIYELRPSAMTDGTTIEIHLEAIKAGNPSSKVSVGLLRAARVTLTYPPETPPVQHQVFTLGAPGQNTSIDAIGSDAYLFPFTYTSDDDHTDDNHIEADSGDSVWEYTQGLNNVLMELLSHSDTTQQPWHFELWTYAEGALDWHKVRDYTMPGPTSGTSTSKPAVHLYFDAGAVLDGQQFVMVARGLTGSPTAASLGSMTIDLNTNFDTRFPRRTVLANGLITTEQITGPETSRKSGERTWPKPKTAVNRWEMIYVLVEDGNGAQHSAAFDVSSWRRMDETKQMNCEVRSQAQLGADQTLSRAGNGALTYSSGSASVEVLEAYIDIER